MTEKKELNQYTKEEVIQHYKEFATVHPGIFIDYTWPDLRGLSVGEDFNGLIAHATVPDLGQKAWKEVVEALRKDQKKAYNKLIGKKAIYLSDVQAEHTQMLDLKGEKKA